MTDTLSKTKPPLSVSKLKTLITSSLENSKAEAITVIDLRGKSDMADYMIVATGRSDRHVKSIADHLTEKLESNGISAPTEGMGDCNWVLVDAFDIIVHIFRPEVRSYYNLEKMWEATFKD